MTGQFVECVQQVGLVSDSAHGSRQLVEDRPVEAAVDGVQRHT